MVNDVNISNLPVKLHIKMESTAGVTVETPPTLVTAPLYLSGGLTTLLFGTDLADYFNINNLLFKGYSKQEYQRTGQLPEGFWRFTVEILHYGTNRPISNRSTATAWIALGKPPQLKTPDEGAELGQIAGMPLTFSWLPSNVGVPIGSVQYTLELWELRVPGIDPYVIAASMPALHSRTQRNTTLVVHPAELFLEPGMRYAWRVTAADASGYVPFEQDGHSQIRTFTYQSKCDSVTGFTVVQQMQNGTFRWQPKDNHTSFNVEVRNPATGGISYSQNYDNTVSYSNIPYGTTYQMRVQAVCNGNPQQTSEYSGWRTLAIPERKTDTINACPDCSCKNTPPPPPITNFTLRKDLQPGDIISNAAGTTRFIVKTVVSQGDGVYKGIFLFWAEIWKLKFLCNYWDLSVNTDNVIVKMNYESIYNPQFLLDVDAAKAYIDSLANAVSELTTNKNIKDTVKITQPINDIYTDKNGQVIIVTINSDGSTTETPLTGNYDRTLIQGPNGEEYVVTSDGAVMGVEEFKATGGNGRLMDKHKEEKEAAANPSITFTASPNQTYGFDEYGENKTALQNEYPALKGSYRPAFKSVESYKTDKVQANVEGGGITFRNEMGIPPMTAGSDLIIRGGTAGSDIALYAYQKQDSTEEIAGKLDILSFDEKSKKVFLVSVNGAPLPEVTALRNELNKIYAPAIVRWEVTAASPVNITFANGQMTHGGTGALSVYNADQKKVFNAFGAMEKDALYLFFVKNIQGNENIKCYMPLQYQQGFIYDFGNTQTNTIAHELAHGAFNLYHTFSNDGNNFVAAQGTTANLMDYNHGAELWKHQWQLIDDPKNLWFKAWQSEEEGEGIFKSNLLGIRYKDSLLLNNQTLYFLPLIGDNVTFFAKRETKEGEEELKVHWAINGQSFKSDTANFVVNDEFFGDKKQVKIEAKDKVIFGTDSLITVYVEKISINTEQEIIKTLLELLDVNKTFGNTVDAIDAAIKKAKFDNFLIKGNNNVYVSKGMYKLLDTAYTATNNNLFELIHQLYEIDVVIAKYEGKFDQMIDKINSVITKKETGEYTITDSAFREAIILQLKDRQHPVDNGAEQWYLSTIKELTIKIITTYE
jgi:hypothetical protein